MQFIEFIMSKEKNTRYQRRTLGSFLLTATIAVTAAQSGCAEPLATSARFLSVLMADGGLSLQTELDRPYVTRSPRTLKMDVFRPAQLSEPAPAVIVVYGGFWLYGDRRSADDWAADLARQGYVTASIDYRLVTEGYTYPAPVADVLAAVAHVREHADELRVDPERIALLGVSSGAGLALLAGMACDASIFDPTWPAGESTRVRAVIEVAGTTDFTAAPEATPWYQELVATWLLGCGRNELPQLWREASPVTHARPDGPPILVLHGALDLIAPVTQARSLVEAMEAAGQSYEYIEMPFTGHEVATWASPPAQEHRPDVHAFLKRAF